MQNKSTDVYELTKIAEVATPGYGESHAALRVVLLSKISEIEGLVGEEELRSYLCLNPEALGSALIRISTAIAAFSETARPVLADEPTTDLQSLDVQHRVHDVKNFLLVVGFSIELLFEKEEDEILRELPRTSATVNGVLEKAKAVLEGRESENSTVETVVRLMRHQLNSVGVLLNMSFDEEGGARSLKTGLDLALSGDDLLRLFFNLMDNARHHGRATSVSVFFKIVEDHLQIQLSDNGENFRRNPLTVRRENGHGFGVSKSVSQVRRVGGTMVSNWNQPETHRWTIMLPLISQVTQR